MDRIFKICMTFKFSDFVIRSLLSADSPFNSCWPLSNNVNVNKNLSHNMTKPTK